MRKAWCILCVTMVFGVVGVGCTTGGMKDERILRKYSKDAVVLESRSPEEIISAMQVKIQQAYRDELVLYAPKHLAAAENAFDKARTLLASFEHVKAMQEGIYAEKVLQAAYVVKKKVSRVLSRTLERKQRLEELGVTGVYPEEYGKLALQIRHAIEAIEDGDMDEGIEAEADLIEPMSRLEVELVKVVRLAKAREALARAETEGADKVAPKSWAESQTTMTRALLYIEKYPRNDAETLARGEEAYHAALHALFMSREAKAIADLGEKELWEEIALELEAHLSRISVSLGAGDLKYMPLRDQAKAIAEKANEQTQALVAMAKSADMAVEQSTDQVSVPVMSGEVREHAEGVHATEVRSRGVGQDVSASVRSPQVPTQRGGTAVSQEGAVQANVVSVPVVSGIDQVAAPVGNYAAPKHSGFGQAIETSVMKGIHKGVAPQSSMQGIIEAASQEKSAPQVKSVGTPVVSAAEYTDVPVTSDVVRQDTSVGLINKSPAVELEQELTDPNPVLLFGEGRVVKAASQENAGEVDDGPREVTFVRADKSVTESVLSLKAESDKFDPQPLALAAKKDHAVHSPFDEKSEGSTGIIDGLSSNEPAKPERTDESGENEDVVVLVSD
ncbi:consensus disorder prediction [Desulfoluna spongiiphila]|nr:consensus disorder prediction [Desulfoluna spongiiphila]